MLSKNCDSSDYDELSAAKKPKLSSTVKSFSDVIKVCLTIKYSCLALSHGCT